MISNALSDIVSEVFSSLDDHGLYFRSSAQVRNLTLPLRLSFRNIIYSRDSSLSLSLISPAVSGLNVLFMWRWSNCLDTTFSPFSLNFSGLSSGIPVSFHGALLRRSGRCIPDSVSSLVGPLHIHSVLMELG